MFENAKWIWNGRTDTVDQHMEFVDSFKWNGGDVSVSLCRPMDLYGHWFSLACGTRLSAALMSLPAILPALLMPEPFRAVLPGVGTLCLFFLSALLALGVTSACAMLMYEMVTNFILMQ